MRAWRLLAAAVAAVVGCTAVVDPQLPPGGVPLDDEVEIVLKSHYSGHGQRQRLVIRDAEAWGRFWERAHSSIEPMPPTPDIDFSRNVVVAATMGSRSHGGFSIQVESIYELDRRVNVVIRERSPGANCITTAAFTAPATAVRIGRPGAEIVFVERTETFSC